MQSYVVRSTILILVLSVGGIFESFAETEAVTATKKHEASAGSGGGHKPGPDGQFAPR